MVVAVWFAQLEVASRFMWAGALGGSGYQVWGPVWSPTPTVGFAVWQVDSPFGLRLCEVGFYYAMPCFVPSVDARLRPCEVVDLVRGWFLWFIISRTSRASKSSCVLEMIRDFEAIEALLGYLLSVAVLAQAACVRRQASFLVVPGLGPDAGRRSS